MTKVAVRGGAALRLPRWPASLSRNLQYTLDSLVLVASFAFAYLLRFEFQISAAELERAICQAPVVILVQFLAVFATGIHSYVWRYIGMAEIGTFVRAAAGAGVPLLLLRLLLPDSLANWRVPYSIILMDTVFAFGGLLALRVVRRAAYEREESARRRAGAGSAPRKRVLLAGAGRAGVLVMREITSRGDLGIEPVGFVDDDPHKQGAVIQGIKVLGRLSDLTAIARDLRVEQVVITMAETGRDILRSIVQSCERLGVSVRIIPGLYEILQGRVEIARFREVGIEDLLGRAPVKLDEDLMRAFLSGKRVLVTGAGGSIGSELCRQLARLEPARLAMVERSEAALFEIDRELRARWPELDVGAFAADAGDGALMKRILAGERSEVLLHAAANKHVPLSEANACEAVRNNVLATQRLAQLAGEAGVGAFVMLSTDKAVRPVSIMGATKRVAELILQRLGQKYCETRFVGVRFGNVMGSTGSVIPIFRQQIARGGPVTVTHPEATRYFMTIPEAAQLVLEAGALGRDGEIMILDMGEPIRIVDLARDMIRLSGLEPGKDVEIVFTGLRPGEKLFEQLDLADEQVERTRHPKILVGRLHGPSAESLDAAIRRLARAASLGLEQEVRACLSELLPEAELAGTPPKASGVALMAAGESAGDRLLPAAADVAPARSAGRHRSAAGS